MNSFLDEVKTRRSVRTFDGKAVSDDLLQKLKDYAESISNPYNIPVTFGFFSAKEHDLSSPVLTGVQTYVTAKVKAGPNADIAYGYSFQNLLMEAHHLGLGTVWIGGTMPREKFESAAGLSEGEIMPCMSPLGYAAKMGIKEVLMRKGVRADSRFDFKKLFFFNDWKTPLSPEKAAELAVGNALEAVRLAPSAVNKQPWRAIVSGKTVHFYENKDRGYDNGTYDLQKVDLGIALYNFDTALKSEGISSSFSTSDPGIELPDNTEYIASFTLN